MRIAHLSDVHLGYRQFQRQTPNGINQREADVAAAFDRAISAIIDEHPDFVLVAGDLFHSVRPTNPAILHAFNQFRRLRESLPSLPVVIIAGNHDTPRSVETGSILRLFEAFPGITVVTNEARRLSFRELDLSVLCVPHETVRSSERPIFDPDDSARWNVLLTHGEVAGVAPYRESHPDSGVVLDPDELRAPSWNYVALGHYHVTHSVAPNAWFAGSLEYVTSNPWGESRIAESHGQSGKGWLLVTLDDGLEVEFRPVELNRRLIDLPEIQGGGMSAGELNDAIAAAVAGAKGGIDNHVVRQLIWNVPRSTARDLDHRMIREFKNRALNFQLDLRRPEAQSEIGVGAPGKRLSVPELVLDYLQRTPLDGDVDRSELLMLAQRHLAEVERLEEED